MSANDGEQTMLDVTIPTSDYPPNDDIPEEIEDGGTVLSATTEDPRCYAPPPRIAARFCRPSTNRRRSSATSSRRNSLSSTHSHSSARSLQRRGCQSNHVAQHLRRASIIESRKARLAERAAHAEQVRFRAAMAKATPRSTNTEERALAAQLAREKHLAQVAAACADEVKRAKRVAEEMKERKAAYEKKYRLEMEEKLAEAEKRRLLYNRNFRRPRTSSSPSKKPVIVAPVLSKDIAAKRIQSAWRIRQRRKAYEDFAKLDLTVEKVCEATFEAMTEFVVRDDVISVTSRLLRLLSLLPEQDETNRKVSIKSFLTAYLVLGHPADVLSKHDGDQEQHLMNKAKELLIGFESTVTGTMATRSFQPDPTQLETLIMAHSAYVTAFSDWRTKDHSMMVQTMIANFVTLDSIWLMVKDDTRGEVDTDYRDGIRDNQLRLMTSIYKLVGKDRGMLLIKRAIRESRMGRRPIRPAAQVRPRPAEDSVQSSSEAASTTDVSLDAVTSDTQATQALTGNQLSAAMARAAFSALPSNRVVAHEFAIDKDFRIERSDVKEVLNQELCNQMRAAFENGEGDGWTVAMAENIQSKLLRLLKPGNSMYKLIADALDPEFVARQCKEGLYSYERFFSFMATILPKFCAPLRDEQVKKLAEELEAPGDLHEQVDKIFKILQFVDLLSLDYSNYLLMNLAPTLIKEAPAYEQREFAKDLDEGRITLEKTKRWWHDATISMVTEIDRRDPLQRPTTQKIYARGLVDLAIHTRELRDEDVPETLELDKERLAKMRDGALRIATVGAALLTAKNLLRRDVRSPWKSEANRLCDAVRCGFAADDDDGTLSARLFSIIESGHPMPDSTKAQLASTIARFVQQAQRRRLTDPVLKLLFQRLKTHVFNRLSADSSGERVRVASTASEGLASTGLAEFVSQVGDIVNSLGRIGEVDRKAHAVWYEKIVGEVEGTERQELESGAS